MKNFLLLCIVWTFTAFSGIALAVPPPPPPHHHHAHYNHYYGTRYNYNRPTVYINQPRFTVYGSKYGNPTRRPYVSSYCLTRNYSMPVNISCERELRHMPTHTSMFYGY